MNIHEDVFGELFIDSPEFDYLCSGIQEEQAPALAAAPSPCELSRQTACNPWTASPSPFPSPLTSSITSNSYAVRSGSHPASSISQKSATASTSSAAVSTQDSTAAPPEALHPNTAGGSRLQPALQPSGGEIRIQSLPDDVPVSELLDERQHPHLWPDDVTLSRNHQRHGGNRRGRNRSAAPAGRGMGFTESGSSFGLLAREGGTVGGVGSSFELQNLNRHHLVHHSAFGPQ
ncbi:hypothetical protein R1sor_027072 [Riccia sorocarpa]|uniref:Uncharacterized protein n=1 Tax=Riccia sorocarpa TaxID=122646 RepID=A0ABD3GHE2_9MARC